MINQKKKLSICIIYKKTPNRQEKLLKHYNSKQSND